MSLEKPLDNVGVAKKCCIMQAAGTFQVFSAKISAMTLEKKHCFDVVKGRTEVNRETASFISDVDTFSLWFSNTEMTFWVISDSKKKNCNCNHL